MFCFPKNSQVVNYFKQRFSRCIFVLWSGENGCFSETHWLMIYPLLVTLITQQKPIIENWRWHQIIAKVPVVGKYVTYFPTTGTLPLYYMFNDIIFV